MAGRSRSPRSALEQSDATARIAAAIEGFSERPEQRPAELGADESGAFRLRDLMRTWGGPAGLKERDVLRAVRAHMLHEGAAAGSGHLRFSVDCDASGQIIVRSHAKGDVEMAAPAVAACSPRVAPLAPRSMRGSALLQMAPPPEAQGAAVLPGAHAVAPTSGGGGGGPGGAACLDAPLDVLIRGSGGGAGAGGAGGGRAPWRTSGERVQRWIGWVLKNGHRELGIAVEGGWARLDALADALRHDRARLGNFDAASLRALLLDSDDAGRFELDGAGRVRKTSRGRRGGPPPPGAPPRSSGGGAPAELPPPPPAPGPPRPRSASPPAGGPGAAAGGPGAGGAGDGADAGAGGDDAALALACRRALRVSAGAADGPAGGAAAGGEPAQGPPPPPGACWTKYQDDGSFWWHYAGPLGSWWCSGPDDVPEPYEG